MTPSWQGKIALVTGASSGIGAAVARRFAQEGLHVILVARRADKLRALVGEIEQRGGKATLIVADLVHAIHAGTKRWSRAATSTLDRPRSSTRSWPWRFLS